MSDLTVVTQARAAWRNGPFVFFVALVAILGLGGIDAKVRPAASPMGGVALEAATRSDLTFSDPPGDGEFLRTGLFDEPLVPTGPTESNENADLGRALKAYESARVRTGAFDELAAIDAFLVAHAASPWRASLLTNEGSVFRRTGHFSKALKAWQTAWAITKDSTDARVRAVADTALASLAQFEAYLGRKELLAPLLQEVRGRPVRGAAAQRLLESRRGLSDMLYDPGHSFRCGPLALAAIAQHEDPQRSRETLKVLDSAKSTPDGLSLTDVQAASVQAGMNYQMAFRSAGAPLVVPSVAHWKLGHYAALVRRNASGSYQVQDATFGEDVVARKETIDEEASGYFLVPPGPLAAGLARG